jgi:ketosteroid isomerase-like protein
MNLPERPSFTIAPERAFLRRSGEDQNLNQYCLVYKVIDGKIKEITEYLDTELVTSAFGR